MIIISDHNIMPTAAVAILGGECGFGLDSVKGVVRFIQLDEKRCVIDGTIDGLSPGLHGLHVHQFGDISNGCNKYVFTYRCLLCIFMHGIQYSVSFRYHYWHCN